jgi:hypothetical protein
MCLRLVCEIKVYLEADEWSVIEEITLSFVQRKELHSVKK